LGNLAFQRGGSGIKKSLNRQARKERQVSSFAGAEKAWVLDRNWKKTSALTRNDPHLLV
jgi:hypothetical protein